MQTPAVSDCTAPLGWLGNSNSTNDALVLRIADMLGDWCSTDDALVLHLDLCVHSPWSPFGCNLR